MRSSPRTIVSLLIVLAMTLTACGSGAEDETTTTSTAAGSSTETTATTSPDTATTEAPSGGGDLRVIDAAEPLSLNANLQTAKNNQRPQLAITEPLVKVDATNSDITTDGLAVGWEQIDDLTWRVTFREGVTFSNGEPFDADAVVYSFDRARHDETSRLVSFIRSIETATKVDDHTVDFTTSVPDAAALARLSVINAVPPAYHEEVGAEGFGLSPIGTGPFQFDEWAPGQFLRLVRNDGYWGGPAPLDSITFTWAAEASARIAALESGDVDLVVIVPPALADTVSNGEIRQVESQSSQFLAFNTFAPPFDDVRLRQAVGHAIDRDVLVEAIFGGAAVANPNIFPLSWPASGGHGDMYFEYDPDASKALIAEYEADNGPLAPVTLHWPIARYPGIDDMGEAIAGLLENAGFTVERAPQESGSFFTELFDGQMSDMHLSGFNIRFPHEDAYMASRFVSNALAPYCHKEPELDAMVNEALAVTDRDARTAAYNELEAFFLFERVCWTPLLFQVDMYAVDPDVVFEPRPDELIDWTQVSFAG